MYQPRGDDMNNEVGKKKKYSSPILSKYGKIRQLTKGGLTGHNDPGGPETART
jgi:hypothetical protein